MGFGNRVRILLKAKDMKVKDLADALKENPGSVSSYLNGTRTPRYEFMMKIINFFSDADLNWLLRDDASGINPVGEEETKYQIPKTPETIIENIEGDLKELKALLAQK